MKRLVGWVMALALACGALALTPPTVAASVRAPFCAPGVLRLEDLPPRVSPGECPLIGRTITAGALRVVVPEPGRGRIVTALGRSTEGTLQVRTLADGTVELAADDHVDDAVASEAPVTGTALTNDTVDGATPITLGDVIPAQTTFGATRDADDNRADMLCNNYSQTIQESVWYRLDSNATRDVLVRLQNQQHVGEPATYLLLEAFTRDSNNILQRATCNAAHVEAEKGVTYFIRVASVYGTSTFDFFARAAVASDRPANDMFGNARDMVVPSRHDVSRLRLATLQANEPKPGCGPKVENTVWYRLRPGALRRVLVESDGAVSLYRGSSIGSLTRIACTPKSIYDAVLLKVPASAPLYVQMWRTPSASTGTTRFFSGEPCSGCPPPCVAEHHAFYAGRPKRSVYRWRFNSAGVPDPLTASTALAAVKRGLAVVTQSKNDCGMDDRVGARSEYLGRTSLAASLCTSDRRDGVGVIEFGRPPSDFLAVTCSEWVERDGKARFVESDVRIRRSTPWTLDGDRPSCLYDYDLIGTLAHETGHLFGLTHPRSEQAGNLTMFPESRPCSGAGRTLGRGDLLGLRTLY